MAQLGNARRIITVKWATEKSVAFLLYASIFALKNTSNILLKFVGYGGFRHTTETAKHLCVLEYN